MKKSPQKLGSGLGPLEKEILELLWQKQQAKVRDIYDVLKKKRKVAHTSIAVLLDRLHERKLVKRSIETCRGGYRYVYSPASEKEDYQKAVLRNSVDNLIERFGNIATAYFDERFGKKR
ncbi:BlaI/MecI/CopY family transcriptional regulator [Candidatus Woesearchaeota archaeon]|nr:BlaI/MecI/CopY family transcriptional regulator [Candidatus Woesearchaeota archaeon]